MGVTEGDLQEVGIDDVDVILGNCTIPFVIRIVAPVAQRYLVTL